MYLIGLIHTWAKSRVQNKNIMSVFRLFQPEVRTTQKVFPLSLEVICDHQRNIYALIITHDSDNINF